MPLSCTVSESLCGVLAIECMGARELGVEEGGGMGPS